MLLDLESSGRMLVDPLRALELELVLPLDIIARVLYSKMISRHVVIKACKCDTIKAHQDPILCPDRTHVDISIRVMIEGHRSITQLQAYERSSPLQVYEKVPSREVN